MVQIVRNVMLYRGIGVLYVFTVLCVVMLVCIKVLIEIPPQGSDAVTATMNQAVGGLLGLLGIIIGFICGKKDSEQRASDRPAVQPEGKQNG